MAGLSFETVIGSSLPAVSRGVEASAASLHSSSAGCLHWIGLQPTYLPAIYDSGQQTVVAPASCLYVEPIISSSRRT